LLIIGGGLGSAVSFEGVNYQTFIYPGVLIQTALFSSVFFGVYIVWDKKIDFMKEVLVSPMRRTSLFVGKILGGSTDTLLQILILFSIGFIFMVGGIMSGLHFTIFSVLVALAFLLIVTIGLVSIGLILGSQMESPEGFQLIISFLVFQHTPEDMVERLFQDGHRILKSKGYYFFQIPLANQHKCTPCNNAPAVDMVYWTQNEIRELAEKYRYRIIAEPENSATSQFFLFQKI